MKRQEVFDVISAERDFQDEMSSSPNRPDMIEDLHMGDILSAIQYNLNEATKVWYKEFTIFLIYFIYAFIIVS